VELKTTREPGLKVLFTRVTAVLEFCNKMVEETKNALLDGNAEVDVDEPGNKVFEEGSEAADFPICVEKVVRRFRVAMDSIDSFADCITAIDKLPQVLEETVELTSASELLRTGETDANGNVKVVLLSTSNVREVIGVRELAEVTRNVSPAVVLIGDNAEVVFSVGDDLIIFNVEFPKTPLALFDVTMLVNFKLVTTGEAVKDERRTSVDGTFGCKGAVLVKFLLTVDMLVITELDQSKAGLDE